MPPEQFLNFNTKSTIEDILTHSVKQFVYIYNHDFNKVVKPN